MRLMLENRDIWISIVVVFTLYFMIFFGFIIVFKEYLYFLLGKIKMRWRLRVRRKAMEPEASWETHLKTVLGVSLKWKVTPQGFVSFSFSIYALFFFVGIKTMEWLTTLTMAAMIGLMPYLLLRVRMEGIRRKSSYEGEKLLTEFLCQYRINHFNIYKTIEQVISISLDTKISRRLLFQLLVELQNTGNQQKMKAATQRFSSGIHTGWSRMLSNCIYLAAYQGINISLALEDILIQLRDARILTEERKRLNAESARMVVYLAPLLYIMTTLISIYYLDIPIFQIVQNQFYTQQGFLLFLLITFLFLFNIALIEIINNQRFDY